ncbi:MAG: class I SAM-dependent methyltransferase [Phycisphaerae bacterium]|nr:class I SAM-dependent methyltransferase [Phycisphaerae bacterium]
MRLRLWKRRAGSATTGRFELVSRRYAQFRPGYAPTAIDSVLRRVDRAACRIADIGAGTGIASRQIADAIAGESLVDAVDPNDAMRSAAAPHPRVRWHSGDAGRTGLADGRYDLVVCAQAFHWFEPGAALAEFARLLKPGGRLVIMNNRRDRSNAMASEYQRILDGALGPHHSERFGNGRSAIKGSPCFGDLETERHVNDRMLSAEEFVGYARSSSRYGDVAREEVDWLLREAHRGNAEADGRALFRWITEVHSAARAK